MSYFRAIESRDTRRSEANLNLVRQRIDKARATKGLNVSSSPQPEAPALVFTPSVFSIPQAEPNQELVAIMMPFDAWFTLVAETIKQAAAKNRLRCRRGDDIWNNSVVVQDIFDLIYQSHIVVCDFTGRNPNVFYEAGIAHTLGRHLTNPLILDEPESAGERRTSA